MLMLSEEVHLSKIWSETPLADVCRISIDTSLVGVGDLGAGISIADIDALGGSTSLEDGWKIWSKTPLADICRIGIETSLVGDGDLGAGISFADMRLPEVVHLSKMVGISYPRHFSQMSAGSASRHRSHVS